MLLADMDMANMDDEEYEALNDDDSEFEAGSGDDDGRCTSHCGILPYSRQKRVPTGTSGAGARPMRQRLRSATSRALFRATDHPL